MHADDGMLINYSIPFELLIFVKKKLRKIFFFKKKII